jgi:recombination protein RecA
MAIDRKAIMEQTLAEINKITKADGDICDFYSRLGSTIDVETISTGSLAVDSVIGGGFARGRVIEIVGMASSGKTTLALTAVATMQKENPDANILYVDAENALDPVYAKTLGVNLDDVIISQPSSGENGYKIIETFINSGVGDLVVIDSLAFMIPKAVIQADYDNEPQLASSARLNARALPRIAKAAAKNNTTVIIINQWKKAVRINPYDVGNGIDGNMYQPGGNSLHFILTQMLEIKKIGTLKTGNEITSNRIQVTVKKNKIAPPYRTAEFVITYGKGLDRVEEIIGLGLNLGLIKQAGSFYTIPTVTEERFQGRTKLASFLENDANSFSILEEMIRAELQGAKDITLSESDDVD